LFFDIDEVVAELLAAGKFAVSVDLSNSRKPRCYGMLRSKPEISTRNFPNQFRPLRPGPHETHVATENVPELRKFIHGRRTEDPAHAGNSRVTLCGWENAPFRVRVRDHGAELNALKFLAVLSHSRLPVENGTAVLKLDGDSNRGPKSALR